MQNRNRNVSFSYWNHCVSLSLSLYIYMLINYFQIKMCRQNTVTNLMLVSFRQLDSIADSFIGIYERRNIYLII